MTDINNLLNKHNEEWDGDEKDQAKEIIRDLMNECDIWRDQVEHLNDEDVKRDKILREQQAEIGRSRQLYQTLSDIAKADMNGIIDLPKIAKQALEKEDE